MSRPSSLFPNLGKTDRLFSKVWKTENPMDNLQNKKAFICDMDGVIYH